MALIFAGIDAHLGVASAVLLAAFAIGVLGHVISSRLLILLGIAVIAVISLLLLGSGELHTA